MVRMRTFCVSGPEYTEIEPVLDDGSGPSYQVRDSVEVRAADTESAKFYGFAQMVAERSPWLLENEGKVSAEDFIVDDYGPDCAECECPEALHQPSDSPDGLPVGKCPEHVDCLKFVPMRDLASESWGGERGGHA